MLLYNHMAIFAHIALQGNFSKAAERLGLPKSTVSLKLRELEQHLGVRLLHRTTRHLILTEQGRQFLERCENMIEIGEDATQLLHGLQKEPQGNLKVSCPFSMSDSFLCEVVIAYTKQYPKVTLNLISANSRVDVVKDGFDLALRFGDMEDSMLVARKVTGSVRRVLASPAYLEMHGDPSVPEDLNHHHCLVSEFTPTWTFQSGNEHRDISPDPFIRITDVSFAKKLAVEGVGICMLPDLLTEKEIKSGTLVPLLTNYSMKPVNLNMVLPGRGFQSASVKSFIETVLDIVKEAEASGT